jgi:predicted permease
VIGPFFRNVRYALRSFRNSPTFTAVAIASLALGIGANASLFNLVNALLLRPLPVAEPSRLVSLFTRDRNNPGFLLCSYPNYRYYRDRNTALSGLLLFSSMSVTLTSGKEAQELPAQIVSGNYFDVLGVRPILGRAFAPDEDQAPGAHAVAVISYQSWTRRFAGSRQVIGQTINLDNHPFTIIGVAPENFRGTNALVNSEVWVPIMMYQQVFPLADWFDQRRALLFAPIGRLKEGVSRAQAEANLRALASQLEQAYPDDNRGRTVVLMPLTDALIHPNYRGTFVLAGGLALGASGLILLIACANVASLLLVRAAGRRKEMAIRLAMGVRRRSLIAQLMTEGLVLAAAGGVAALAIAHWARNLLWAARPPWVLTQAAAPDLDWRVLGFTLLLCLLTGAIFGLAPALETLRSNLATELRERRSSWTRAKKGISLRSVLVAGQVALSLLALTAAGLFIRSLSYAQQIDPGFAAAHLLALTLDTRARGFSEEAGRAFYRRVSESVLSLPGVEAASLASDPPFRVPRARSISVDGQGSAAGPEIVALINSVEPGYFPSLRIPVLHGRTFTDADSSQSPRVALINETTARRFWSGKDPIGQRLRFFGENAPAEIVGVVRDSAYLGLGEPPRLMVYVSLWQSYSPVVTLYVRTAGDPGVTLSSVRRAVQAIDPSLLLSDVQTLPQVIQESLWAPRLEAILFGSLGGLAVLLTLVGVYGVISYSVGQRTREIGIRMALGAQASDLLRQVLGEGARVVILGMTAGLVATLAITRQFSNLLLGVSSYDPLTLGAVTAVVLLTALAACYFPARRATRVDPLTALREE